MSESFVITVGQFNPTVGDLTGNIQKIRDIIDASSQSHLIVLPELALTGYSPEDLLLKKSFMTAVEKAAAEILEISRGHQAGIILPLPIWDTDKQKLFNAIYLIHQGHIIATRYKHNLPNYRVFDEKRYFTSGPLPEPIKFMGINLGVMICEDMWFPEAAANFKDKGAELLIVTNASPYEFKKHQRRLDEAGKRVAETGLPILYVHQTAGQDDVIFDGASFMLNESGTVVFQAREFIEKNYHLTLGERNANGTWLIAAEENHPILDEAPSLYQAATLGLRDYINKNKIPGVILGLSGGIDSALVASIAVDALGPSRVRSVMMPSPFTSQSSLDDAATCANSLGIQHEVISIGPLMSQFENTLPLADLAHQNMQSRLRGMILMSLSNNTNWMVLSTGNKSEIACGYSTLYGDMCGGYNPIKDIYKTQVFKLAAWRNEHKADNALGPNGIVIPPSILSKAPSAELKPDQIDEDSLPPYDILDQILTGLIEEDFGSTDLIAQGLDSTMVTRVARMLDLAEFKRRQAAPGPKVSFRAFVRDRRYPIVNGHKQ